MVSGSSARAIATPAETGIEQRHLGRAGIAQVSQPWFRVSGNSIANI
jgi:hypothetical protein